MPKAIACTPSRETPTSSIRAAEARNTIRQAYRQAGFPFDVEVDLEVTPAPDLAETAADVPVRLTYVVDEAAEVEEVRFSGNTVLTDSDLRQVFRAVTEPGEFAPQVYRQALEAVANRYLALGYRGSGVDAAATGLQNGVLDVVANELMEEGVIRKSGRGLIDNK